MSNPLERVDDLQFCGLKIIQNPQMFCFGMDAVLLSDFAMARPGDRVADLGTGTGILPLLISGRAAHTVFDAFEIQPDMADMARRSVTLNSLESRITIHEKDLRQAADVLPRGQKDLVICNPPYGKAGSTLQNPVDALRIARHEGTCTLLEIVHVAKLLLKNGGRLAMVFPAQRMLELMDAMRQEKIEPKRLRLVYPKADKPPNLVLIDGVKDGKPQLHLLPPLIVYDASGNPTQELDRIYHRT